MDNNRFKNRNKLPFPDLGEEPSLLSLHDDRNPDLVFFNYLDQENIKLSGSRVFYFKFYGEENYDKVYLEERNKVIAKEPIVVWCSYDPKVIEENLTEFGLEMTNDQVFVFNKSYIDQMLTRAPRAGDIIKPQFQNMKFEIFEVQEDSFEVYGVYHYNCFAKVLRDSADVVDEPMIERPDPVGGLVVLEDEE